MPFIEEIQRDPRAVVESQASGPEHGAHLINSATGTGIELFYWRERGREVDFVELGVRESVYLLL